GAGRSPGWRLGKDRKRMAPIVGRTLPGKPGVNKEVRRRRVHELLARYHEQADLKARDQVVRMHLDLVRYLAGRFRGKGEPLEDLIQIGCVGLIKAIERFDPERKVRFSTYVSHFILGEIKRHFRDKGWTLKVPRRLQDLHVRLGRVREKLANRLGRNPTVQDLARELEVSEEEVLEAQELGVAYQPLSLEAELSSSNRRASSSLLAYLGRRDPRLSSLQDRLALNRAIAQLSKREQLLIYLRFWENFSQKRTGEVLGISQMQISRIQRRILKRLGELLKDALVED
ncbi:MAG TPA: SigB/SigF/SigG family RNA polymerase sigma factor, partial [Candidatus Nitrosotenuis sp.]|nr:SigB/SigF/SigG family RNA polymerase sigma factor [Candidatus Nitrosotenuis sp.]